MVAQPAQAGARVEENKMNDGSERLAVEVDQIVASNEAPSSLPKQVEEDGMMETTHDPYMDMLLTPLLPPV